MRPAGVHEAAGDSPEAPPARLRPHPGPEGRPPRGRRQLSAATGVLREPLLLCMFTLPSGRILAAEQASSTLAAVVSAVSAQR